jgi:hypothetical protein
VVASKGVVEMGDSGVAEAVGGEVTGAADTEVPGTGAAGTEAVGTFAAGTIATVTGVAGTVTAVTGAGGAVAATNPTHGRSQVETRVCVLE